MDAEEFSKDVPDAIQRAKNAGVHIIINQGVNFASNESSLSLGSNYEQIRPACGLYPLEAIKLSESEFNKLLSWFKRNAKKIAAFGEVGLDKHWDKDEKRFSLQIERFERIVELAKSLNKPLIVHSRKAESETLDLLEKLQAKKVILHCFGGKHKLLTRIIGDGWFLSIPASIAYDRHFRKIVENVPLSRLLCETDSPYLSPCKGERNEPANVVESYKAIAEIKGMELIDVKNNIFLNYQRLFSD